MSEVVSIERDGAAAAREGLRRVVEGGGVAVFPADTLYGLACDPTNGLAVERIHRLKGRDDGKPSAVLFLSPLRMREVLTSAGSRTRDALGALLPGPVTLVIANPGRLYPLACRALPKQLGVRLIDGPLAGTHLALFQTSANRSGEPPPARFADVPQEIATGADLLVDGGELAGEPSTVVDLTRIEEGEWSILRHGALADADVAAVLAAVG